MSTPALLLVGFGNTLAADDGLGPEVVRRLQSKGLPTGVRVVVARSDALDLADLWRGEPAVWMIDAVIRDSAPGTIHLLEHPEVLSVPQRHGTVHHLSLPECLRWLMIAIPGLTAVRFRLLGIEPARVGLGEGLSPAVDRAVDRMVARLLEELEPRPASLAT